MTKDRLEAAKNRLEAGGLVLNTLPMLFMALGFGVIVFSFMRPDKYGEQGHLLGLAVFGVGYAHLRINRLEAQKKPENGDGEEGTASQQSPTASA